MFLSGATALVYQLLWVKQLSLVVGVEVFAVTLAVSAFFAGLAAGSAAWGRLADRGRSPLRMYALLEAGTAVLAVGATLALGRSARPFAALEAATGPLAWILPLVLVGVPAFLMGGTLPVMTRARGPGERGLASVGGKLYAANTAGAVVGTLLAPFILLPWLGVRGTALLAGAVNLGLALVALRLARRGEPVLNSDPVPVTSSPPRSRDARVALCLYAIAGGLALGYEVVWSQVIVQFTTTRAVAFAIVLATYLLGLASGSALFAGRAERAREPWVRFGLLIGAAGLFAILGVFCLGDWIHAWQTQAELAMLTISASPFAGMAARFVVAAAVLVFMPTLLLGAALPVVLRLADSRQAGTDVGSVVALNTAGGIVGTLVTGFVLVPAFGLVRALGVLAIAAGGLGTLAVWRASGAFARIAVLVTTLLSTGLALATPRDRLATLLARARGGSLTFYDESAGGTVAVLRQGTPPGGDFNRLYIQGISNSGDALPSRRYMRLQALLPLLIHAGEPRSTLVIGFGTGITAGSLLQYPGLERRVVAELLPAVVRASRTFDGTFGASTDPRLDIRLRDGRRELLRSGELYDLITLEPPPPSAAGAVNLYSLDFYELARTRLKENGLLAQWWPLSTQNDEDSRAMVRSFLDAFLYVTLWTTEMHEMMLVGSMQPIELDAARIAARFAEPGVASALAEVGVASPAALLSLWVTRRFGLERYAATARGVTDDFPAIEYAGWLRPGEFARVLPEVLALYEAPPLRGESDALRADVAAERETLLLFYEAGLAAYVGDRAAVRRSIDELRARAGANPYYRLVTGAGTR